MYKNVQNKIELRKLVSHIPKCTAPKCQQGYFGTVENREKEVVAIALFTE